MNTIVMLPISPDLKSPQSEESDYKQIIPWAKELIDMAQDTIARENSNGGKCYRHIIFPQSSLDNNLADPNCLLQAAIPGIRGTALRILMPGHSYPLGIGAAENGPVRISPKRFASTLYNLLSQAGYFQTLAGKKMTSLSIELLSCNACTPFCGTDFSHEPDKMKRLILKTSFAGRFLNEFIKCLKQNSYNQIPQKIQVSGVVGFYASISPKAPNALVFESVSKSTRTVLANHATVTLACDLNGKFADPAIDVSLPCSNLLSIKPSWLLPLEDWQAAEKLGVAFPESSHEIKGLNLWESMSGLPVESFVWDLLQPDECSPIETIHKFFQFKKRTHKF
jgi:hypothetical protein